MMEAQDVIPLGECDDLWIRHATIVDEVFSEPIALWRLPQISFGWGAVYGYKH